MLAAMSSYETMSFTRDQGVARITLNRPHSGNALSPTMCRELADVVTRVDVDKSVGALLIDATGKLFCSGGDLAVQPTDPDELERSFREFSGLLHIAVARLVRLPVPVVVAVQGVAAGAGVSIACAGDLVLVGESARFTLAYTKAGLVPDGGASWLLPRLVGLRRAQELVFTNRVLTAEESVAWGLATRVVKDAELAEQALGLARQIAAGPTGAYAAVKRLYSASSTNPIETQMELESREIARAAASADGREGMLAFREKRAPRFGA
jgi:2-(1,2-epoxy-1,2-dihydrophenyl)acetyl-CoA isomerase